MRINLQLPLHYTECFPSTTTANYILLLDHSTPTQLHSLTWKCPIAPQATMSFIQAIVWVRGLSVLHLQPVSDLIYMICQSSVPRRLFARQSIAQITTEKY
jgi:hypothetical protein